jgi:serine/threonine protein kinase
MDRSVESDELLARRRVGEIVGPYRLEQVLGIGGMAAVYLGRAEDGSVAAVKLLHPEMAVRADVRERFYREGYVANSIQHPGVVRVLSHGAAQEAYLAMELLSGETLSDRVRRHGQLPIAELLDIAEQVLDVLVVAHERGIVHRDLKPDNLFVTQGGAIKILDFGLARLAEAAPSDHRTRTGVALGTLPYMAPEQALGRLSEIDGRVDIFALGATLFKILTGRRVHESHSEAELLMAMASKPAPALASIRPDLPGDLARMVDLALAFSRDARYPDARTMQNDVRALRTGLVPPYASARFSQREQKTRAEPAAIEPLPRSYGPQGTVPIAIHRGAPLGQTRPSAGAPPAAPAVFAAPAGHLGPPQSPATSAALPPAVAAPQAAFGTTASGQSLGNAGLGQTYPAASALGAAALGQVSASSGAASTQTPPAQPMLAPSALGPTPKRGARRALLVGVLVFGLLTSLGVAAAAVWVLRSGGPPGAASGTPATTAAAADHGASSSAQPFNPALSAPRSTDNAPSPGTNGANGTNSSRAGGLAATAAPAPAPEHKLISGRGTLVGAAAPKSSGASTPPAGLPVAAPATSDQPAASASPAPAPPPAPAAPALAAASPGNSAAVAPAEKSAAAPLLPRPVRNRKPR